MQGMNNGEWLERGEGKRGLVVGVRVQQIVLARMRRDGAIGAQEGVRRLEDGFVRGEGVLFLIFLLMYRRMYRWRRAGPFVFARVSGIRHAVVALQRREAGRAQRRGVYAEGHAADAGNG